MSPTSTRYLVAFQSSSSDPTASRNSHMVLSVSFPPESTKHCPAKVVVASGGRLGVVSRDGTHACCVHPPPCVLMALHPPNRTGGTCLSLAAPLDKAGSAAPHPLCPDGVWDAV